MSLPFLFQGSFMINVAAALLPAIYLMRYIYQKDSIEKEPRKLLIHLVLLGVGSAFIAMILEGILGRLLNATMLDPSGVIYNILLAFIVVAVSEEGAKYVLTHLRTWKDPAFNYKFDAVVYCVFTSLGFAAFENVLYVLQGGLGVALMRAVLSIPGHMSFAVVMGVFYGRAKQCQHYGDTAGMKKNKLLAFVWAVVAHGFYDACLMVGTGLSTILFVAFVIFMYVFIFRLIKNEAATDEPVVDCEPESVRTGWSAGTESLRTAGLGSAGTESAGNVSVRTGCSEPDGRTAVLLRTEPAGAESVRAAGTEHIRSAAGKSIRAAGKSIRAAGTEYICSAAGKSLCAAAAGTGVESDL